MQARALPVTLAALLVSCGGGSRQGYPLDSGLASAIPADTVALAGARWDLLQKSPLYARLQPLLPTGGVDAFGIDARKDVREIIAAYNGREPLLLVSGTFKTQDVLNKLAAEANARRSEYKGKPEVSRAEGGVAALSGNVLAAGPLRLVHGAIDRLAAGAKLDERWAAGLRATPAQAQIFFLTSGGATLNLPRGTNLGNLDKILGSVESLNGWADLSKSIHIVATASARDAAAAKQLHTQLRGIIGLGRLSTPDNKPELLKFYDAIQTRLEDKRIELDLDLPEATLATLLKQFRP
jgi:hypothetical protein